MNQPNNVYTHVAIQKVSHFISTSLCMKFTDDEKGAKNAENALLIAKSYCRCGKDEKFAKYLFEGLFSCNDDPPLLAEWIRKY